MQRHYDNSQQQIGKESLCEEIAIACSNRSHAHYNYFSPFIELQQSTTPGIYLQKINFPKKNNVIIFI